MIYIDLPTGDGFGWGVCGDSLARVLAGRSAIERLPRRVNQPRTLSGPLLQAVNADCGPRQPGLSPTRRVGYAFFEEDVATRRAARTTRDAFDVIAAGSRWCEDVLREAGLTALTTIHQGVDTARFNPARATRTTKNDRFVIFSGGKFELRKGQDIVVRAFLELATRHDDVFLVAAWHNAFAWSAATMSASPYFPFVPAAGKPFEALLQRWLANTGVDTSRVELLPRLPNADLAALYGASDVGLFPNRCEGGTNLVLMEYMACGRPAIATDFSGHRDVLTDGNGIRLRGHRLLPILREGQVVALWCEPSLDEILEALEAAYQGREWLADLGRQAADDLSAWTWDRAGDRFFELLVPTPVVTLDEKVDRTS